MDGATRDLSTVTPELLSRLFKVGRGALEEAAEPHRGDLPLVIIYTSLEEQTATVFETAGFPPVQSEA